MAFARILRSSVVMGGASVVTLATNLVRAKVVAVLIGAQGVGLMGILTAFNGNVSSLAGWGLGTTGVRALSAASPEQRPAKLAAVRGFGRILSWVGLGLVLLVFWPVSLLTFPESGHELDLLCAGLAVPLLVATGMWSAVLQAGGHLRQLAMSQIAAAIGGLVLGIPFVWVFGMSGIAPSMVIAAAVPAIVTWRYASKLHPASLDHPVDRADIQAFIAMGGALTLAALVGQLAAFGTRVIIVKSLGLEAAGYYQAAFSTAGSLPGFVFAAMCADFFPRVAAASTDEDGLWLVESQIQAGLLLTLPALALLLVLGGWCMRLLFSHSFEPAVPVLTWMVCGVFVRVISFPMGYFLLARGSSRLVLMAEALGGGATILLTLWLTSSRGLAGAGQAFLASSIIYTLCLAIILRAKAGRWVGSFTILMCLSAALALASAKGLALLRPEWWWQSLLVAGISLACAFIYMRTMHREKSTNTNQAD